MKYAKIENDVVVQVQPNKQDGFVEVEDSVICGMVKNGEIFEIPKKSDEEINQKRLNEIDIRLVQIDNEKVRPTSSITTAQILGNEIDQFDIDKLVALENEVIELRTERKALV